MDLSVGLGAWGFGVGGTKQRWMVGIREPTGRLRSQEGSMTVRFNVDVSGGDQNLSIYEPGGSEPVDL